MRLEVAAAFREHHFRFRVFMILTLMDAMCHDTSACRVSLRVARHNIAQSILTPASTLPFTHNASWYLAFFIGCIHLSIWSKVKLNSDPFFSFLHVSSGVFVWTLDKLCLCFDMFLSYSTSTRIRPHSPVCNNSFLNAEHCRPEMTTGPLTARLKLVWTKTFYSKAAFIKVQH